ncbi:MAG: phytanoyl-CoA dioxygenase family protein [Pseudomonadota bacterium]
MTVDPNDDYRRNGYCVFPNRIDAAALADLRQACDTMVADPDREARVKSRHKINVGERRLFLARQHEAYPAVASFVLEGAAAELARELIGPDPRLFTEQFVFKAAGAGSGFAWHQDSGYVGFEHRPYLTLWCALDDATLDNGCVHVLPRNLDADVSVNRHRWDDAGSEMVGYDGDKEGIAVPCEAGTIVAFSSVTLHRSGPNRTQTPRRAYVCQYSAEPIVNPETGETLNFAKPLPAA